MIRTVFFADVLGFSSMAREAGAGAAVDALSDLATLLSQEHAVARYLNRHRWERRYALSDSVFLVGRDPVEVCAAAAEFFFNLAFYSAGQRDPALLRGAIAEGEVRYAAPIFPTAESNLVGAAVVEAVTLERLEPKGPRWFVSPAVAARMAAGDGSWLLEAEEGAPAELLWLLPPDRSMVNADMIASVCDAAGRLFERHARAPGYGGHYVGYLDLVIRSLSRLRRHRPEAAAAILQRAALSRLVPAVEDIADSQPVRRLRSLLRDLLG